MAGEMGATKMGKPVISTKAMKATPKKKVAKKKKK